MSDRPMSDRPTPPDFTALAEDAWLPAPPLDDIPTMPGVHRQRAYDAVCAVLRAHPGMRNSAPVWQAVDAALDTMGVPRGRADGAGTDLDGLLGPWLVQCGRCDTCLPVQCVCTSADVRPVLRRLAGMVVDLRSRVTGLQADLARELTGRPSLDARRPCGDGDCRHVRGMHNDSGPCATPGCACQQWLPVDTPAAFAALDEARGLGGR